MGTLTEASFLAASGRRYGCRVGAILRELDDEDRTTLLHVLSDRRPDGDYRISHRGIAVTLTGAGHRLSDSTVRKHRIGGCECQA